MPDEGVRNVEYIVRVGIPASVRVPKKRPPRRKRNPCSSQRMSREDILKVASSGHLSQHALHAPDDAHMGQGHASLATRLEHQGRTRRRWPLC